MGRITDAIADPYSGRSLSSKARARRWNELLSRFDLASMRVVDLGGDARHWRHAPVRPRELVLVNLFEQEVDDPAMSAIVGDACAVPESLAGEHFDLVYSNSVIEHVGGFAKQQAFAGVVGELADHHWIQTPYRYFPIEPHWVCPGFQFLPAAARVGVTKRWPLGHRRTADHDAAVEATLSVQLLSKTEMRHFFAGSDIWEERFLGLTKSLVAAR